ncbi:HAMP domain-containing histidine kinase [Niabella sp. CC-SYL272]|uniref:sensor histidine kinase n=1 Tax=Niabella agricola TaxID=2891571 RepID=UPI001F372CD1|nr:HAMP domain-containing sensor histidine kinase [Niabella agricola]MCF3111352.1 HAMP domain-containing histidine kinase [Niabella agricola]
MKLINKISLWFLCIILVITPVTMIISRAGIKRKMIEFEEKRLLSVNERIYNLLKEGLPVNDFIRDREIEIAAVKGPVPRENPQVVRRVDKVEGMSQKELALFVTSYQEVNGVIYKVTSHNYFINPSEFFSSMFITLLWKMLLLGIAVLISARVLSRILFKPFKNTMEAIRSFNIRQKQKLQLERSSTKEFNELNCFIETMTNKAMEEYATAREFSENASHELQTPLAVLRTKTELLTQTSLNSQQADLIEHMQTEINKLSNITKSLVLLARMENHEFNTREKIRFCRIAKNVIETYSYWADLKNITVTRNTDSQVFIQIHPTLADILVANLMRNAIRYNEENGSIHVELTTDYFRISNTGAPVTIPHKDLFRRFKKGSQKNEGVGLGLAIVKQICEVCNFRVSYAYVEGRHIFCVYFNENYLSEIDVIPSNSSFQRVVFAEA